jgi:hypothetical protein
MRLEMADKSVTGGETGASEPGGGHVQGRATYSQFRRFTTSARIIPLP